MVQDDKRRKLYRWCLILLIVLTCVSCDQATKAVAREHLAHAPPISLLNGIVHLEYAENLGAFLGMGANLSTEMRFLLGTLFSGLLLALAIGFIVTAHSISLPQLICLALFTGGGIGNLIDRIWNKGAVTDFMMFTAGPLHTGILNVADIAITFGALAFVVLNFFERPHPEDQAEGQETDQS
jgi:signal peptidase II